MGRKEQRLFERAHFEASLWLAFSVVSIHQSWLHDFDVCEEVSLHCVRHTCVANTEQNKPHQNRESRKDRPRLKPTFHSTLLVLDVDWHGSHFGQRSVTRSDGEPLSRSEDTPSHGSLLAHVHARFGTKRSLAAELRLPLRTCAFNLITPFLDATMYFLELIPCNPWVTASG